MFPQTEWSPLFSPLSSVFDLLTFLPGLSVSVRRLHDLDRRGWWLLIALIPLIGGIVLIVVFCQRGEPGDNRFGPDRLKEISLRRPARRRRPRSIPSKTRSQFARGLCTPARADEF
jgi:hypothetical protein